MKQIFFNTNRIFTKLNFNINNGICISWIRVARCQFTLISLVSLTDGNFYFINLLRFMFLQIKNNICIYVCTSRSLSTLLNIWYKKCYDIMWKILFSETSFAKYNIRIILYDEYLLLRLRWNKINKQPKGSNNFLSSE